ncbi:MAG TPA: hypothetical protein DEA22_05075 [Blastocatellia bacterium]|nr:hypothetical protein [Blastocatellia bacterium]
MKKVTYLFAIATLSIVVLGLPAISSAQGRGRDRDRNDDYYGTGRDRNDDYYGNGRNDRRGNRDVRFNRNLNGTVKSLRNRSSNFEKMVDRLNDRRDDRRDNGRFGRFGSRDLDRLETLAERFKSAAKKLDNSYDDRGDFNKSEDEVRRVLDLGSQIENEMYRVRGDRGLDAEWNRIQSDLRVLANAYGYNFNGRGNNRGRFPF